MLFGRFLTSLALVAFVVILAGVLFGFDQRRDHRRRSPA